MKHTLTSYDSNQLPDGSVLVLVTGKLYVDNEANPLNFSEVFVLKKKQAPPFYYVFSNLFRFNYG